MALQLTGRFNLGLPYPCFPELEATLKEREASSGHRNLSEVQGACCMRPLRVVFLLVFVLTPLLLAHGQPRCPNGQVDVICSAKDWGCMPSGTSCCPTITGGATCSPNQVCMSCAAKNSCEPRGSSCCEGAKLPICRPDYACGSVNSLPACVPRSHKNEALLHDRLNLDDLVGYEGQLRQ